MLYREGNYYLFIVKGATISLIQIKVLENVNTGKKEEERENFMPERFAIKMWQ